MTQRFISAARTAFSAKFKLWRDVVFPPFCRSCKERSETKLFCPDCWTGCSPPEREGKCPHCFEDSEGLCEICRENPELSFPRAYVFEATPSAWILAKESSDVIGAFMMHAWGSMDWPVPDVIIPMAGAFEIASHFSSMIKKPIANLRFEGDMDAIDAGQILLIIDVLGSLSECTKAVQSLSIASPKKGYLISLFPLRDF